MFKQVQVGDIVTRNLGGMLMKMRVTKVDEKFIHTAAIDANVDGWKFSRETGAEHDEELGWDDTRTGSYLTTEAQG